MNEQKIAELVEMLHAGIPNSEIRMALGVSDATIRYWKDRSESEGHQFPPRPMGRPRLPIPKQNK